VRNQLKALPAYAAQASKPKRLTLDRRRSNCEQRVKEGEAARKKADEAGKAAAVEQKKQVKKVKKAMASSAEGEEDLDALLAEYKNDYCWAKGCKKEVGLIGKNCDFCGQRFCLPHIMPEMHGCGDAVGGFTREFAA